jgi:hypothetical protein
MLLAAYVGSGSAPKAIVTSEKNNLHFRDHGRADKSSRSEEHNIEKRGHFLGRKFSDEFRGGCQ